MPARSKCSRTSCIVGIAWSGLDPQHGGYLLAEPRIRCGHHDRLGDGWHREQDLFDFQRADVFAAPDDDVGLAVGQSEIAVVVDHPDVTGVIPTVVSNARAVSTGSV